MYNGESIAVTCSGRRRACIHPCGFKDSVALTGPLHHRFTIVFFSLATFALWILEFILPRVSGSPLFCVCVSLEKYRILDSGRRLLENVSVFCAMLGSTADTCSYVSLQRLFVIFFVKVDSDPELAALVDWTTPGVVTPVKLQTVWLLQVFLSASSLQVRVALCAGNLVLLSAQQLVVATPRIHVAVVD